MSNLVHAIKRAFVTVGYSQADFLVAVGSTAADIQIQAAIDYVVALGGGIVFIKKGTYNTSSTILLNSNVEIVGESKPLIKGPLTDTRVIMTTKTGTTKTVYSNIIIRNIKFESQNATVCFLNNITNLLVEDCEFYFSVTTPIRQALYVQHCAQVTARGNYLHDLTGNGISITSTDYFNVTGNTINGGANSDDMIDIDIDFSDTLAIASNHGVVIGNVLRGNARGNGIRAESVNYIVISGNEVTDVSTDGGAGILINQHSSVPNSTNVTVDGNVISDCVTDGIRIQGSGITNVTVSGNVLDLCGQAGGSNLRGGITVQSTDSVSVLNNTLDTCGKNDANGAAIIMYKSNNHNVKGNYISNSPVGIRAWNGDAASTYTDISVSDNHYKSNTTNEALEALTGKNIVKDQAGLTTYTLVIVGPTEADYITDGTADNVQIQAALDAVNTAGGGKVLLKKGTYNVTSVMTIGSNTILEGEEKSTTIIKKVASQNNTIFNNKDSTNGNSYIQIRNLTIDQNGANQSGGGGCSFTGLFDSTIENVIFEKSRVFNLFVGSLAGTSLTGTLTFTNGDTTVTGSGTSFTTELAVGDIVKSNGGHFQRVTSIASNTSLELDRIWGWATESGVAAKRVPANARNRLLNCQFKGTVGTSDNVGLGLFDDSLIQGCTSTGSTGYGFGPDHANRVKFIGNTIYDCTNAGIGMETCGYCVVSGNVVTGCGAGVYLLSGAYRNIITNNQLRKNTNGVNISYNSTSFPKPDENTVTGNDCELNTTHGVRIGGAARTLVANNRCANNDQNGIVTVTDNSLVPSDTLISGNHCYDNQDTKTQDRGIYVLNGTRTLVLDNISRDSDHTIAGIVDTGTDTMIVTSGDNTQKAVQAYTNNIQQVLVGTIFTQTADKTVTNTVTETSIIGTGVGTVTLPANFFVAGKTVRLRIGGIYSTPSLATPSVVVKVKYGSTVVATVTTSSLLSGATSLEFDGEIDITCRTTGSSGTVMCHGDIEYATGVAGTISVDPLNNAGATTTINTTTSNALDVTVTWDTATSTRIAKSTVCTVEVLN